MKDHNITIKTSTLSSYLSQDLEAAARAMNECGLDGLDLDRVWEQPIECLADDKDYYEPLQHITKKTSLKIFCLATSIFHCWLDSDAAIKSHLRTLVATFRLAEKLNCHIVRCYAFMRNGDLDEHWPRLTSCFQEAASIATDYGMTLAVQNDSETFLGTGREVGRLLNAVKSKNLQAVWDPCASILDIDRPEIPFPDGYRALQGRIAHIMLRDIDTHKHHGGMFCEVELGEGIIDVGGQLRALKEDGYGGVVSFSSIWRPGMMWHGEIDEGDFTEAGAVQAMRVNLYNSQNIMNPELNRPPIDAEALAPKGKIHHE
jgi:sugar phosphate isomerase/epimerase